MKIFKIEQPILRTVIAIVLGMLVLMMLPSVMMIISKNTDLFESFPMIEKTITHTSMLILSVLFILILNKGKLKEYGFTWNLNFPLAKVVMISLLFGFISSLTGQLFVNTKTVMPTDNFSFIELILYIWVWASICEEILTRGLIQGFLAPLKHIGVTLFKYRISLPVIVGAIFFGTMHFGLLIMDIDIYIVLNIVIFGIILGMIAGYHKEKTNSLVPAIIVHFCFNVGGSFIYIISLL